MNFRPRLKITLRRARTIREWLALLVISCLLPTALAIVLLIYQFYQNERTRVEHTTIILLLIIGTMILLMMCLVLAKSIGDRITRSIRQLAVPAIALGYGDPVVIPELHLKEADDIGAALIKASELLNKRTVERDQAEKVEQEMRLVKQQLEQSEALQRSIFEEAPDAILLVASSGFIVRANAEAERMFSYTREQLLTLTVEDLMPVASRHRHMGLRESFFAAPMRRPMGSGMNLLGRRADDSVFPIDVMLSPLDSKEAKLVIAVIRDITDRRYHEEQVNALNKRLALATQASEIGVWDWDLSTNVLIWDERMYALYKVPEASASNKYEMWRQRLHPDDVERAERDRDDAMSGKKLYATEFRIVWPSGEIRSIRANAVISRNNAGQPLRMTGVNWDVTDSKQKEQTIIAALHEKETLLKELYHRVKNNLQVVTSLFNLQARTFPKGPAQIALQEGADRVRAIALVHEKLYQSGNLSSIALDDYIADLCRQLGHAAAADQRGIHLIAEAEPVQVGLDIAVPLGLLLNELISNSLKHAFPDGRHGRIVVRLKREVDDAMHLAISDDGIGLPPGLDPTFSHTLGLKLVNALAAQLDGEFSLENHHGAHASLRFRLTNLHEAEESGSGL